MKRLITLLIISLASPSLASAQFVATGGGTSVDTVSATSLFEVFGPAFEMVGHFSFGTPFLSTGPIGEGTDFSFTINVSTNFGIEDVFVDVASVGPLTDPQGFFAFEAEDITVPGPGAHTDPFLFESEFSGPEGDFTFVGEGTITYKVVPTGTPGLVSIVSANYIIPEPSTASLLFIGVAGFAVMGRRRKSGVALFSEG